MGLAKILKEEGRQEGLEQGLEQGIYETIRKMLKKGLRPEEIARLLDLDVEVIVKAAHKKDK